MSTTSGYPQDKRKALLDGMLFEIFFDKDGKLRKRVKRKYFEDIFELQQHDELRESFEFIAKALTAAGGDFYAVPGKGHELAVSVSTKKTKDGAVVDAIYIGGEDVLRIEDEWVGSEVRYANTYPVDLTDRLCEELYLPTRLLKVSFTPKEVRSTEELLIPRHWTIRKPAAVGKALA